MAADSKVDDVVETLERARKLGKELGSAADSLNVEIEGAEKDLAKLRLGVAASIELTAGEQCDFEEWLAFRKHGDVWRLVVEVGHPGDDEGNWTTTPLVSMSRDTRKQALAMLPRLLEALISSAERELSELTAAVQTGASFRAALRTGDPAGKAWTVRVPKQGSGKGDR